VTLRFHEALSKLPLQSIQATVYRAVPESAADFALEDGPSFPSHNRYNLQGRFGALYFGDRPEVCRATLLARGYLPTRSRPHIIMSFDAQVEGILDLSQPETITALGIERRDLVCLSDIPDAYAVPNAIALAAYCTETIRGLWAPDATETGRTLTLYPAKLLATHFIRPKERIPL
jgi:hypothetical protein